MKKQFLCALFLCATFLLLCSVLYAAPRLISYQGILNDAGGDPVDNDTLEITFSIYDVATGGTALWSEVQTVKPSNGVFNVKLGEFQDFPPGLFQKNSLYLGVKVSSDTEMTPRQEITSAPYTIYSVPIGTIMAWAKNLNGVPALSADWVECNGQTLSDPDSPLDGQVIPDLNGGNRFLRGNAESGATGGEERHTLTIAEMPSHSHEQGRYGSTHSGASLYPAVHSSGYSYTGSTGGGQSHENRPPFYDVVWIIRVK